MRNKANFPWSDVKNFQKVLAVTGQILENIDPEYFISPYSVIPVISQILGLNTPDMGGGKSIYSITSIVFELTNKKELFVELFEISLDEKRKIIDEMYEMIAPILLSEEAEYIDLLIKARYKNDLNDNAVLINVFQEDTNKKLHIFEKFVKRFNTKKGDFGYIVHYGSSGDLYREYPFLEKVPGSVATEWRESSFPVVNEVVFANFPSSDLQTKKTIRGWVIFITNDTKELLGSYKLRKNKIIKAAKLAKILGSKIIGMGGLIASFAQGGHFLSKKIPDVGFTTGHAYTIGNIIEMMINCAKKVELSIENATVAVVGAAGSIGSGCASLLVYEDPKKIILIDRNSFGGRNKLVDLSKIMKNKNSKIDIMVSDSLAALNQADIVIVATNSPTAIISSKHLKPGAIVIDDSFPKNVPKSIIKERKDIILLEGGIMQLPFSLDMFFARNMPDLMDAPLIRIISCKETYGCFAEILVLALSGHKTNYGLGQSSPFLAKRILKIAKKLGFMNAPLQCFNKATEKERMFIVKEAIKEDGYAKTYKGTHSHT
ncbi:MAG: hypothetical protein GY858_07530 [Candidatus Omnitrophica bacterium]|nr:hypothetical protein [Candidatus Omnitrophota bacterium]